MKYNALYSYLTKHNLSEQIMKTSFVASMILVFVICMGIVAGKYIQTHGIPRLNDLLSGHEVTHSAAK